MLAWWLVRARRLWPRWRQDSARPGGVLQLVHRTEPGLLDDPTAGPDQAKYVGAAPRLATCSGVSWYRERRLAATNLLGHHLRVYALEGDLDSPEGGSRLRLLHERAPEPGFLVDVAVSHDQQTLAVTSLKGPEGCIHIFAFDPETGVTGPRRAFLHVRHKPHGLVFSPDDRHLVFTTLVGSARVQVCRVGEASLEPTHHLEAPERAFRPKGVGFLPDGRELAVVYSGNARPRASHVSGGQLAVFRFDPDAGRLDPEPVVRRDTRPEGLDVPEDCCIAPDPEGETFRILASDQRSSRVLSLRYSPARREIVPEARVLSELDFPHGIDLSPDGTRLAVANYGDDTVRIFRLSG